MNDKLKNDILNIFKNLYEDNKYVEYKKLLDNNEFNELRLIVEKEMELMKNISSSFSLKEDFDLILEKYSKLEDLIFDLCISNMDVISKKI